MITYEQIKNDNAIKTYIKEADKSLEALGYTEHNFAHVTRVAVCAGDILSALGYSERECELARISGYLHDIGNLVNRVDHSQSGAILAFRILDRMGMEPAEIAPIVAAIGNHDEGTGVPVSAIAAAVIIADKSDVRRTRVRNKEHFDHNDIHDKVNYSTKSSAIEISKDKKFITLVLDIDTSVSAVMEYFEIFLGRMLMCKSAAEKLGLTFKLNINGQILL